MKKVSTIAAKQIRNFPEAKLTIGLDLGDRSSWYCVSNEAGEILLPGAQLAPKLERHHVGEYKIVEQCDQNQIR